MSASHPAQPQQQQQKHAKEHCICSTAAAGRHVLAKSTSRSIARISGARTMRHPIGTSVAKIGYAGKLAPMYEIRGSRVPQVRLNVSSAPSPSSASQYQAMATTTTDRAKNAAPARNRSESRSPPHDGDALDPCSPVLFLPRVRPDVRAVAPILTVVVRFVLHLLCVTVMLFEDAKNASSSSARAAGRAEAGAFDMGYCKFCSVVNVRREAAF